MQSIQSCAGFSLGAHGRSSIVVDQVSLQIAAGVKNYSDSVPAISEPAVRYTPGIVFNHSNDPAMPTQLSVNLNAVAQLRNRRNLPWPSVTGMGRIALASGAHGLTVHPRPDQRHTRFTDVAELRALIDQEFDQCEFNVEGYPTEDFLLLVEKNRPEQVTLVPDDPSQATSDHGWDFKANHNMLAPIVQRLKDGGMRVSLFADADPQQLAWAKETGCDRIELYTGPYGATYSDEQAMQIEVEKLGRTADAATQLGLMINAGHDLTVDNLPALINRIPDLAEVSIGHGLTADAIQYGMAETVKRFLRACGDKQT